jgi:hypothetical protein
VHAGAGLYHGFVRRDGVLDSMLPGRGTDVGEEEVAAAIEPESDAPLVKNQTD